MLVAYPPPGTWHLALAAECGEPGCGPVPVLFSVHTNRCVSGVCGRYGRCHSYTAASTSFSACSCLAGHAGPACNDPSRASSDYSLLVTTLLLTTSSLALLPAIMLAAYRGHYSECVVFTGQLIASCLYHACAEEIYSVCLVPLSLLSFCDQFTTSLTLWVTLLTVPALPHSLRSALNTVSNTTKQGSLPFSA